jgi:hypothetical protein
MMLEDYSYDGGGSISHRYVSELLTTRDLEATVHTHRDAEIALAEVPTESVLGVRPTGLASSYSLTQRPLTVIELDSLAPGVRERVAAESGVDLDAYSLLKVGRATRPAENRSLAEF